jgi:hypothetical protein
MEAQLIIDGQDLILGDADPRSVIFVKRVGIRNDRVEIVVGSAEL